MNDILKEMQRVTFGLFLKKKRESRNLSIRKLALASGLSATYLSYLERAKQGPPSYEATVKLAEALEGNLDEFLAKAGHVSKQVSEAYQKNPEKFSKAAKESINWKSLGRGLGLTFLYLSLKDELSLETGELLEPREAFQKLKDIFISDDISLEEEMELIDYGTAIMIQWQKDIQQRKEKSTK